MLVDTHCHLDDPALMERLPDVLAAAARAGVGRYVIPGVSPDRWESIALVAAKTEGASAAYGLHPMFAANYDDPLLDKLRLLAVTGVAVGEIGLDYLVDVPREVQKRSFRSQVRFAVESRLPVIIHCRRAFADLLEILREEQVQQVGGVMHAFSGSPEMARLCIDLGLAIGVAGPVTYRNAVRPVEVVKQVPLDFLVLETDAPDLAPERYRGQVNEPSFLAEIAGRVAEIKGISPKDVATITTTTAFRLFKLN